MTQFPSGVITDLKTPFKFKIAWCASILVGCEKVVIKFVGKSNFADEKEYII